MSVIIKAVEPGSPADRAGIKPGEILLAINGETVSDVLDYRFYQNDKRLSLDIAGADGKQHRTNIRKGEYQELGLLFETYLMDEKRSCCNKCVFCFIDQLPKGLRNSLYFKDDDSRLSFLFGNYITLTNITEHEIERIIKMHISPINISVHTTNPELRVKMMSNRFAGDALNIIDRLNKAGIKLNCQLVLVPGMNDGVELERTLNDLTRLENVECIAAVPVGLTRYREGLAPIKPFDKDAATEVLDIIDRFGQTCIERYSQRRVYGADEFYLLSGREIPDADYYEDFLQLENGVGLWALLLDEAQKALENCEPIKTERSISIATGTAAYPLIKKITEMCRERHKNLRCEVYAIKNNFFGQTITVAGLVTAADIYEQLKGKNLGSELLIPSVMLRKEGDLFLDSVSVEELSKMLNVKITPVDNDGFMLIDRIFGI